jgi:hypothetical protein
VTLTDNTTTKPTGANILQALTTLIAATQVGDVAFVWFSGHGTQIQNDSAPSGFSNAWFPLDGYINGLILETELQDILTDAPTGAKVFVGADCCNSGTLLDLKYMVGTLSLVRKAKAARPPQETLEGGASGLTLPPSMPRPSYSSMQTDVSLKRNAAQTYVLVSDANFTATNADIVCLSGCMDDQTSSDAYRDNEFQGAMTWSFLTTLTAFGKSAPMGTVLASMRLLLARNMFSQIPQLSFGRPHNPTVATIENVL